MKKMILFLVSFISSISFAQKNDQNSKKNLIISKDDDRIQLLDVELANKIKNYPLNSRENILIEFNEDGELIDLKIFNEEIFSESRVDWRTL